MFKLLGVLLNAAGVAAFWFGGVPYTSRDTIVEIGSLKAEADFKHKLRIPPEVAAGAVGVGTVFLLLPGKKKKA